MSSYWPPRLPPGSELLIQSAYAEDPDSLSQENFTDYLLSWLHSGFKSPQASCEQTWLTLHRAPLQDYPPGATSTSSASKTGLPGPFTYPTRSRSFPSSHFSSPPVDLLITLSCLLFDVQTPSFSQRRVTAGAEKEADGPRQDAANLMSLSPFQVLWFNQPLPHKLLWSTFEIMVSAH
ncbi:hypothetical protein CRENBAI_010473 [Crenichthys baileyi]|uniref:Uncharacterized protein n=1 Tax=Crenichthys baileyi TaxID=28760 RepID=A0AAV9SRD7_9TELE